MRKSIIYSILLSGVIVAMTGCDDNAWNDKLDGFESNLPLGEVETIEYTLTAADYAAIASNKTNIALAGDEHSAALKDLGKQQYFTDEITAEEYVPAFLASTSFPYFALNDGSAIKLTYNIAEALPEEIKQLSRADEYIVTDADYVYAWGNDDDYIDAFTPAVKPSKYIPVYLGDNYDDALEGDYVVVNYQYSEQEPIFGTVGGGDDTPEFVMSNVIGAVSLNQTVDINAVVTAICTRGFIATDNTGSILVYFGSGYDINSYSVGDQVVISGTVGSYGTGFQIAGADADIELVGKQTYVYPTPKVLTGADFDVIAKRTDNELAVYCQFNGKVSINGNYVNFIVDGAENAQGSAYYITDEVKAMLVNEADMTVSGYLTAVSSGRYCNFVITGVSAARSYAPVAPVYSTNVNVVYYFNGSKWAEATNVTVLQASDYVEMGQSYGNLSNDLPAELLPIYLQKKYPYAQADDEKFVMYKYYVSGTGTSYRCDQYVYDGTNWKLNDGVVTQTSQFVRSHGNWNYDPSVTITLPAGKSQPLSTIYYQACVDWVYENIDKPLGSTSITSGEFYVTKYGNNEYYSGTSAYQGNVDLRPAAAVQQYPEGYANMTDDEIVELEKERFAKEVMPGALSKLHPDAVPVDGIDVFYTINFAVYNGATTQYTIVYKVAAPGKFEFVSCTWWD